MSKAPMMPHGSRKQTISQIQFGGYNHSASCAEGQIWYEWNMSSLAYPSLRPRKNRPVVASIAKYALFSHNALGLVDGDGMLWYDGHTVGAVAQSEKQIAVMGNRIVIWPDKVVLNATYKRIDTYATLEDLKISVADPAENDAYGVGASLPYEIYVWNGTEWVSNGPELEPIRISAAFPDATFKNGTYKDVDADANTIELPDNVEELGFNVGDAVTISGCKKHPENNKTAIIREIKGNELRFYEFAFVLDGEDGNEDYTEESGITITRDCPDMDVICAANNRLWGAKDDTIYASALGDPCNFNVFDGLTTDSWFQTTGTPGRFTACTMYLGYPMFFKERLICKIYGANAENFQTSLSATTGVKDGAWRSLAIAGEVLYYLSPNGLTAYTGGLPEDLSSPFGAARYADCVSGTDGRRLFLQMSSGNSYLELFCLDTQNGILRREDHGHVKMFTCYQGALYGLCSSGVEPVQIFNADTENGAPAYSFVEFGDFMEQTMDRKSPTRLQMRLKLDNDASLTVSVQYDSDGQWRPIKTFTATKKMSFEYPIKLRRCDHYRIMLEGSGYWELQAMAREFSAGSGIK